MTHHPSMQDLPVTRFLSRTSARAVTPRRKQRAKRLAELEELLRIGEHGSLGPRGTVSQRVPPGFPGQLPRDAAGDRAERQAARARRNRGAD